MVFYGMWFIDMSNNTLQYLKDKYKPEQLRKSIKYNKCNLPEHFWFKPYPNKSKIIDGTKTLMKNKWLCVMGESNYNTNHYITQLMVNLIHKKLNVYYIDFFSLLVKSVGKFNSYKISELYEDTKHSQVISIGNIIHGESVSEYSEFLIMLFNSFLSSSISKQIVIGIEKLESDKEMQDAYESIYGYIDSDLFKRIEL
jgi:hypothetical protein